MYHYVAFIWDATNTDARGCAVGFRQELSRSERRWRCSLDAPGIAVYDDPGSVVSVNMHVLPDQTGVIFGNVFSSSAAVTTNQSLTIDRSSALGYASTGGRDFIRDYWGGYLAFFNDPLDRRRYVLRDCSGALSCFWLKIRNVGIVFADVNDLAVLSMNAFGINWRYVSAFLFYEQLQIRQCGLDGVTEVLAGEVVEFDAQNGTSQRVVWDPRYFARNTDFSTATIAALRVRKTTMECIANWRSAHSKILHSLSGGFDSAVVLGCLSALSACRGVSCINRFTETAGEDERQFARLAASRANVELIERPWDIGEGTFDSRLFEIPLTAKPSISVIAGSLDIEARNSVASACGAEVTWTGQGGDHLFLDDRTSLCATDFVRTKGLTSGFARAIESAARLSGDSYWTIIRSITADCRSRAPWQPTHMHARKPGFANATLGFSDLVSYASHPWSDDVADIPPGKQSQIFFLSEVTNRHRPNAYFERAPEYHPLLSQPLMELCLQIPTYTLMPEGRSRGLAKLAFQNCVPEAILARETKGSTTSYWMNVLHESRGFVLELLGEGILRRNHMINTDALKHYLDDSRPVAIEQLPRLFACIAAEIWARSISRRRPQSVHPHSRPQILIKP